MQGLAQFLEQGGTLMYVNLVVSMITLAIIIDRAIFFLGKGSVNAKAFLEQIRKLVLANNIDRAVKLCSATEAPVAQVARAGLQRVHRGEIAIAQSIEETLVDVTPILKKRVQILWSIANIAHPRRSARYGHRPHPGIRRHRGRQARRAVRPARQGYLRGAQQHRHGSRYRRHLHHRPRVPVVGVEEAGR